MYFISPQDLLVSYLRSKITDPKERVDELEEKSFTLNNTTYVKVTASKNISYVDELVIDGSSLILFQDYYFDLKNNMIIFRTAQTGSLIYKVYGGTDVFGKSGNWIYSGKPIEKLSHTSFPRVSVQLISSPAMKLGNYKAPVYSNMRFQIDVWCKRDDIVELTLEGQTFKLSNDKLSNQIAYTIKNQIEDNVNDLYPYFKDFIAVNDPIDEGYEPNSQTYRYRYEIILSSLDIQKLS